MCLEYPDMEWITQRNSYLRETINPKNMSWSVTLIGKPENVGKALQEQSDKLEGQSKVEYDSALPHFVALVNENFGDDPILKITASGHGYAVDGEQKNRQCVVNIERIFGVLV